MALPKRTTVALPRTPYRIWRPTKGQIEALEAIRGLSKPRPILDFSTAFQVFNGLAKYGYVEISHGGVSGLVVKATPAGRALLAAVAKDPSLIRPQPARRKRGT